MSQQVSFRRLKALCRKETLQILRDPSSNLTAFVLPLIMLFIFGFGINLDTSRLRVGMVLEDRSKNAMDLAACFRASPYLDMIEFDSQMAAGKALTEGRVRGFAVVPQDFSRNANEQTSPPVLIVTDGAEPNTATFVENYARGVCEVWLGEHTTDRGQNPAPTINLEQRFWFNPSAESRNYLIPGSITIIMTVIGALLTSLVVAREWERGTMEALLASPVTRLELLLSKLIPYYALGVISLFICVAVAVFLLHVPFRGSLLVLWLSGSLFLGTALGLGLLLSTTTRNQFNAAQAALNAAFLPAVILSGFIYEIRSMPPIIQGLSYLLPARYFVTIMQTLFQAGDVWGLLNRSLLCLAIAAVLFLGLTSLKTRRKLE